MNQVLTSIGIADVMPAALATGLFVSECTIQRPSGTLTSSGAPDGNWTTVSGLSDLRCMNAPRNPQAAVITADERRGDHDIIARTEYHCLLESHYPTIQENWRAVVDGSAYDIAGVEHDSQAQMTRLRLRKAVV